MAVKISILLLIIATITIVVVETKLNISKTTKRPRKIYYYMPKYCTVMFKDRRRNVINDPSLPMIYFVTPTYPRPEQIPELTRLSHTLMHVPRVYWIVANDNLRCSKPVEKILLRSGLPYTHISSPKPNIGKIGLFRSRRIPRGVANRRAALKWIRKFVKDGIVYFGDDDNVYDLQLFDEIRKTKKLSMVPVGLIGQYGISSPIVTNAKVVGFFDSWYAMRKFPVDMAGFAINIKYLKPNADADMLYEVGMIEDKFLTYSGYELENIEPLANNCSKVLVWHTQTKKYRRHVLQANIYSVAHSNYTNLAPLLEELADMNVLELNPKNGTEAMIRVKGNILKKLQDM